MRRSPRPPARPPAPGLLVVALLLALPGAAASQTHTPAAPSDAGPGLEWSLTALLGSRGTGAEAHAFGGIEGSVLRDRFGVAATGQVGSGNDYGSRLLAAGPMARLFEMGSVSFLAWGGVARYRERLDVGPTRSVTGALVTATARRPVVWGSVTLQASWLAARLDGRDFQETAPVNSLRLAVGIGW